MYRIKKVEDRTHQDSVTETEENGEGDGVSSQLGGAKVTDESLCYQRYSGRRESREDGRRRHNPQLLRFPPNLLLHIQVIIFSAVLYRPSKQSRCQFSPFSGHGFGKNE